jgi:hypothetical protein
MYPTVRPGDVLRVRACKIGEVSVGDIAVCRRPDYLIGHRVVRIVRSGSHPFVVTKPDSAKDGDDGPTYEDDFLGIVIGITRRGVEVPLRPPALSRVTQRYYATRRTLIEAAPTVRGWLIAAVRRLQGLEVYGCFARTCLARLGPEMRFVVRVPLNATLGDALFREVELRGFDPEEPWNGHAIDRFMLVAIPSGGIVPAGHIDVTRKPGAEWQLGSPTLRRRYVATGLDDILGNEAGRLVGRTV